MCKFVLFVAVYIVLYMWCTCLSTSPLERCDDLSMPSAIKGVLIECDPSIRALIVLMDSKAHDIILEELDEMHLFVVPEKVDFIRNELNTRLAANHYNPDEEEE